MNKRSCWGKRGLICGTLITFACGAIADGPPIIQWKRQSHDDRVNSVAFSPDGTLLASGGSDRLIQIHRASDGHLLKTFNAAAESIHENAIENLVFSPDGTRLATASYGKVEIWRVSDGAL